MKNNYKLLVIGIVAIGMASHRAYPQAAPACAAVAAGKPWTDVERWAWGKICAGQIADFNEKKTLAPNKAEGWDAARRLSANFLEDLLSKEEVRRAITHHGVRIVGAWFPERIYLRNISLNELWLDRSRFEEGVGLSGITASHIVSIEGSYLRRGIDIDGGTISGDLFLRGTEFQEQIRLNGVKISGQLTFDNATAQSRLYIDGCSIDQGVFLWGGHFNDRVEMIYATVGGNLMLTNAAVKSLDLTGTSIEAR